MAFTKEAAKFKIEAFAEANGIKDSNKAYEEFVGTMGYDKFLESTAGQLKKAYEKMYPPPAPPAEAAKKE